MTTDELKALLNRLLTVEKENQFLEFKVNNVEKEGIGERLSALSNGAALHGQQFGYLIFGIEDETKRVVGTDFQPSKTKVGNEELENWLAQRLNPRIDFRIFEFEFTGKNLVLIQIPAAYDQPVNFAHVAWIRIGSLTRKLADFPEKERKLWQRPSTEFEREVALSSLTAADVVALLDTQSVFDLLLKIPYPTTQSIVLEKLVAEKLVKRQNGHFQITNLGALLFAKNLNDFDSISRKACRVIQYKSDDRTETLKDQPGTLGYASGFVRMMNYISGVLPSNEVIEQALRKEVQMYPPIAVRELIANALIHQDFREKGTGPIVEVFVSRVEINNPGKPTIQPERFIDEYQSRNEKLAAVMRRIGFCEEKGSGIDKVISAVEAWQLPAPDFQIKDTHFKAILYAPMAAKDMDRADKIRACYQHCALLYVSGRRMNNETLRGRFGIEEKNYSIASRIIRETIDAGKIKLEDPENKSKKQMRYIPYWA